MIRPSQFATLFLFSAIGLATFVTSSGVAAPNNVCFLKDFKTIPHHLRTANHSHSSRVSIAQSTLSCGPPPDSCDPANNLCPDGCPACVPDIVGDGYHCQ